MAFPSHRPRLIVIAFAAAALFGVVTAAQAADLPPILGPMADGNYFTPFNAPGAAGGMIDQQKDHLISRIVAIQSGAPDPGIAPTAPAPAPTDAATSTAAITDPWSDATPPPAPAPAPEPAPAPPALLSAIQRARAELQARIAQDAGKKPKVVGSTNVWVDVTLAVWNQRTDEIAYVHAGKNGTKLDVDPNADLGVSVRFNNGVNTQYAVDDGDKVVVAVRYPIFKDTSYYKKRKHYIRYELQDVVYSPNTTELRTPEMIAYGKSTLQTYIGSAFGALRAGGIRSRAFPDKLLADAVDPNLVQSIIAIEHLDVGAFSVDGGTAALDAVYATVGANQDATFAYARSPAGALGMVQFIPSTYALMAKRSELGLTQDFTAGMSDPVNAIKAEIAYLDAIMADMPASVQALSSTDPAHADEYLAAAYNGGDARVRKAIAVLGDDWAQDPTARKAALQHQYDTLFSEASVLKRKIVAENDPAVWKPMQKRLNASRAERAKVQAQMNALVASSLRQETAIYVQKLRATLKLLTPTPPPPSVT